MDGCVEWQTLRLGGTMRLLIWTFHLIKQEFSQGTTALSYPRGQACLNRAWVLYILFSSVVELRCDNSAYEGMRRRVKWREKWYRKENREKGTLLRWDWGGNRGLGEIYQKRASGRDVLLSSCCVMCLTFCVSFSNPVDVSAHEMLGVRRGDDQGRIFGLKSRVPGTVSTFKKY